MLYWKMMEKISWPDLVKNYKGLRRVNVDSDILHALNRKKANWIGHILGRNCLLENVFEGKVEERQRLREKEEDVSSYWMTLRKEKGTVN
jgi:hypothetical protein